MKLQEEHLRCAEAAKIDVVEALRVNYRGSSQVLVLLYDTIFRSLGKVGNLNLTKKIRLQAPFGDLGCQRPGSTGLRERNRQQIQHSESTCQQSSGRDSSVCCLSTVILLPIP